jgi:RHS repeat-associated protein
LSKVSTTNPSENVGSYTYHATRKHAVISAGSNSYSYDFSALGVGNGNMEARNGGAIQWTSYNYPSLINSGSKSTAFTYNPSRMRIQQDYNSNGAHEITQYVGGLLEKVITGSVTEWRHYVRAGGQLVAILSRQSTGTNTTRLVFTDPLGSLAQITDSAGANYVSESFCPFGARRDASSWSGSPTCTDLGKMKNFSREGFTGQDMIGGNSMGLVHMNGRVEDTVTGRFLSADPFVFEPEFTQAWNRYSYVHNNPMSFVDPSGFYECEPGDKHDKDKDDDKTNDDKDPCLLPEVESTAPPQPKRPPEPVQNPEPPEESDPGHDEGPPLTPHKKCLRKNYGNTHDLAFDLSPLSFVSLATDEIMESMTDEMRFDANRSLNSGRYKLGKVQTGLANASKGASKASAGLGAFAFGYWAAGHIYCIAN